MRPDGAVADPAGDDEQDGAHAVARQHRMRVDPVVQVAVVEGDQHRTLGTARRPGRRRTDRPTATGSRRAPARSGPRTRPAWRRSCRRPASRGGTSAPARWARCACSFAALRQPLAVDRLGGLGQPGRREHAPRPRPACGRPRPWRGAAPDRRSIASARRPAPPDPWAAPGCRSRRRGTSRTRRPRPCRPRAGRLRLDVDGAGRFLLGGQREQVETGQQVGHVAPHAHQVDAVLQAQLRHVFLGLLEYRRTAPTNTRCSLGRLAISGAIASIRSQALGGAHHGHSRPPRRPGPGPARRAAWNAPRAAAARWASTRWPRDPAARRDRSGAGARGR